MYNWNEYFIGIAEAVSLRSKDPRTQVGAVIIDKDNHIISTGYNGFPSGYPDSKDLWDNPSKHNYVIHAEANAICHSHSLLAGCSLYVTHFPCGSCAKLILAANITKVFYKIDRKDTISEELLSGRIFQV